MKTSRFRKAFLSRWELLCTRPETGATAVEYGLMIALIALVIFMGVRAMGLVTQSNFQDLVDLYP